MAGRFWGFAVSLLLVLAAAAGLAALSGGAGGMFAPALRADLRLAAYPLPTGFGIDVEEVAGFLADELQKRAAGDVALRLTMGAEGLKKLQDLVLPRLMSVVVVRAMLQQVRPLQNVLALGAIRQVVTGEVVNTGSTALDDVALTIPGLMLAEADGAALEIVTTDTGLTALNLGTLEPGQHRRLTLWLDAGDVSAGLRLGATGGQRGRVHLRGGDGWPGADLEVLAWARWLILALLAGVLVFGLAGMLLTLRRARPE